MPRLILIVVSVLLLGFAPVPFPKPDTSEADLKAMQGDWVETTAEGEVLWARFDGASLKIIRSGEIVGRFTLTLNGAIRPKSMDLYLGQATSEIALRCIYKFERETLTIYCGKQGGDRPRAFILKGAGQAVYRRKLP
jgi:uncharacterized protein (TIGR03067 family)